MTQLDDVKKLHIPVWVKQGSMLIRRDALDYDDPDHVYNYIKSKYNVNPEDYGIEHPLTAMFKDKTRSELIEEIMNLRSEVDAYVQYG